MADLPKFEQLEFYDLIIEPSGAFLKNLKGSSRVLTPVPEQYMEDVEAICQALKEASGLQFSISHKGIKYRTMRTNTVSGEAFIMRKGQLKVADIKTVGLPDYLLQSLLSRDRKEGLLLISGQMASGKTYTATALVKAWLEKFGGLAIALEDPPEAPLQRDCVKNGGRCLQIDITGQSMADELKNTLRRSANLIFLGELRDKDAVEQALTASINGHLILATVHSNSVASTLQKLVTMGDSTSTAPTLAQGFQGVVHQHYHHQQRYLETSFLFADAGGAGDGDTRRANFEAGVRERIRKGDYHRLGSEIQRQQSSMASKRKYRR